MTLTEQQRAEGWREHDGWICPVDPETSVFVMLRFGWVSDAPTRAGGLRWDKGRTPESAADASLRRNDIIAYRIVRPEPQA